ncbi:MAG: alanine--tRNA ligase [Acidobacteria bacterium]|nr:alanine--tRNA ligase [Acidobacteriota bacterium]MCW5950095.1 alanine--tRNA ligase [Pyrinomonadaceae bacterium]
MSVYDSLDDQQQFACRVIADHARSTAFAIADGILPGNEGRNYVLRKIMRRAIYHGREHLGLTDPFFYKVCDEVVSRFNGAFPELETQREFIGKMVRLEEERFGATVTVGLGKLAELGITGDTHADDALFLSIGKLYDTFGTPRDLIRVFLEEKGIVLDEDDFNSRFDAALQSLQQQSDIGKTSRKSEVSPVYAEILDKVAANEFLGYDVTQVDGAKVVAILDGDAQVDKLGEGRQGSVVLDRTPFYAESGGQVGDTGKLVTSKGTAAVADTYSPVAGLIIHKVTVEKGEIKVGDEVTAIVDAEKRDATRRNHTATHLVHAALKEVLGTHVKQAGSVVAPNYLRFDFAHYQPMTSAEIAEVEDLVNRYILENEPVTTNMMALEDAMRSGAVAMFGEKYGSEVRVLSVGDGTFSRELCGGTHVSATGDIGSFKIISDEAIASGVRRIRAVTGFDSFRRFREDEKLIDASLAALNTQRDNLPNAIARLQEELKRTRKEMDDLKLKAAMGGGSATNGDADDVRDIAGVRVLAKIVEGLDAGATRQLSDTLLARLKSGIVIIGRKDDGKAGLIVRVSDDLTAKVKAGNIIREIAPIVGGKGGGKPDMAEGGGTDPEKLSEAIDAAYGVIERAAA